MKRAGFLVVASVLSLTACGGGSSTSSTEVAQTLPAGESATLPSSAPVETLPALLDPSTDIDGIESPVVLWFWSPG